MRKRSMRYITAMLLCAFSLQTNAFALGPLPASRDLVARRDITARLMRAAASHPGLVAKWSERIADQIYDWYRDRRLQEHSEELHRLGTSPREVRNLMKNLIRERFLRLLAEAPDGSLMYIGAGLTFVTFRLVGTGLVMKIPVYGTDYFSRIERDLRNLRLKFGDGTAETVEYFDNVKIKLSKGNEETQALLNGAQIEDDVLNLIGKVADGAFIPAIDESGNVTARWILIQAEADRLVEDDWEDEGLVKRVFEEAGPAGVERIIDEMFDLLKRRAYPRGIYPHELKFSGFGYREGRLTLFDIDLRHNEPAVIGPFTPRLLNDLDPSGRLFKYYTDKMQSQPSSVEPEPVFARDLNFVLDGMNTEQAQRKTLRELVAVRLQGPQRTIAVEFSDRMNRGETAEAALRDAMANSGCGINLNTDHAVDRNNPQFYVIAQALSYIPQDLLSTMRARGRLTAINVTGHVAGGAAVGYADGVLSVGPNAIETMGTEEFLSAFYGYFGQMIFSETDQQLRDGLTWRFNEEIKRWAGVLKQRAPDERRFDFIQVRGGEEFPAYFARLFVQYLLRGDNFRGVVVDDIAYTEPYATTRPAFRGIYDAYKEALGWREYDSYDAANLMDSLRPASVRNALGVEAETRAAPHTKSHEASSTTLAAVRNGLAALRNINEAATVGVKLGRFIDERKKTAQHAPNRTFRNEVRLLQQAGVIEDRNAHSGDILLRSELRNMSAQARNAALDDMLAIEIATPAVAGSAESSEIADIALGVGVVSGMHRIHEINMNLYRSAEQGRTLYYVIPLELIPQSIRMRFYTMVTRLNRQYPGLREKIIITTGRQDLVTRVNELVEDPRNIVMAAAVDKSDLQRLPYLSGRVKALLFTGEAGDLNSFKQVECIIAALRALYRNDAQRLVELYKIVSGEPFTGSVDELAQLMKDPQALAEKIVFNLKPIPIENEEMKDRLNSRLLDIIRESV